MVVTDIAEKDAEKDQTMSGTERHETDEQSKMEDMNNWECEKRSTAMPPSFVSVIPLKT